VSAVKLRRVLWRLASALMPPPALRCEVCGRRMRSGVRITVAVDRQAEGVLFAAHESCMAVVLADDPALAAIPNVDLDVWT